MSRILATLALSFATVLAVVLPLRAQPLSDRVPADAIVYLAWQGTESLGAGYEQSHLKGLLDASNFPALARDVIPQIISKLGAAGPPPERLTDARAIAAIISRRPSALFVTLFQNAKAEGPRWGLICRAGRDADDLLRHFNAVTQYTGYPLDRASIVGDCVVFTVGYQQPAAAVAGEGGTAPGTIAASERFRAALSRVHKEPLLTAYADLESIFQTFDEERRVRDPAGHREWAKVREGLNVAGLKRFMWTGAFSGPDWETRCFLHAPAPRTGVLSLLDGQAVSDAFLKNIPKSATWFKAGRLDLAKLLAQVRETAAKVDPQAPQMLDQGLGIVQAATRVNLETGLFATLGDEWAIYTDPMAGGKGFTSVTLVNALRNPAEAERSLKRLELFIDNTVNGQLRNQNMRVTFSITRVGDVEVHHVGIPFVSPAWAIKDGRLYAALFPQVVASAANRKSVDSILDNPAYVAARKRLGTASAGSVSFANYPETVVEAYPTLLSLAQTGLGYADMFGFNVPGMVIPPLESLRSHLTPAASASWTDDSGWHRRSVTPFPGASVMATEQSALIGTSAMGVRILLPALNAAKERANRVKSASNLRQIAQGCLLHANDNRGAYPKDLGSLVTADLLDVDVFVDPSSGTTIPPEVLRGTPQQKSAWVNANSDFVYLGHRINAGKPADRILAYSKLEAHDNEGMNIVFNDGHVEWFVRDAALKVLEEEEKQAKEDERRRNPVPAGIRP